MIKNKFLTGALTFVMLGSLASCGNGQDDALGLDNPFSSVIDAEKSKNTTEVVNTVLGLEKSFEGVKGTGRIYRKQQDLSFKKVGDINIVIANNNGKVDLLQELSFSMEYQGFEFTVLNSTIISSADAKVYSYTKLTSSDEEKLPAVEEKIYQEMPATDFNCLSILENELIGHTLSDLLNQDSYSVGLTKKDQLIAETYDKKERYVIDTETGLLSHSYLDASVPVPGLGNFGARLYADYEYGPQTVELPEDKDSYKLPVTK